MKEKKPFKVGATYKLKERYVSDFYWSAELREEFENKSFQFTVTKVTVSGHAMCEPQFNWSVANASERHMFTRVDNK